MTPVKPAQQTSEQETSSARRDSLTITDNRTGKTYEVPIRDDTIHRSICARSRWRADEFGMMSYDPAFNNTASCTEQDHVHRRRRRHPALPRLSDRGTGGEEHLSRDGVSDFARRAAHPVAARGVDLPHHAPHVHSREHQEISRRVSLRRPPDGHDDLDDRGAFDVLSGREGYLQRRIAPQADLAPDRQNAHAGRVRLPAQPGHALRLSGQRPELPRQFPEHAVQDHRAEVPPESHARARAGRAFHSARRSRAELLGQCHALRGQLARRSVFGHGCGHGRALRPAPRRRERRSAAHAAGDRLDRERSRLHQARESRRRRS